MNIPTCVSSFFLGILARKLLWNHQIEPKKWPYWIAVTVQSVDKTLQKIRGVKPEKQKSQKIPCLPAAMLSPPKSLFPRVFPAFSGWMIHQSHSSQVEIGHDQLYLKVPMLTSHPWKITTWPGMAKEHPPFTNTPVHLNAHHCHVGSP